MDAENGLLYLERQGHGSARCAFAWVAEATVGTPPDAVLLAPPRGKRSVARVVDGSYRWAVPEWVYVDRGWPVPDDRRIPGALGPLAIVLDSGAVLYSRPAVGPLSDVSYVLPGSVRVERPTSRPSARTCSPAWPCTSTDMGERARRRIRSS